MQISLTSGPQLPPSFCLGSLPLKLLGIYNLVHAWDDWMVISRIFPWTLLSLGRLCGVVGGAIKALGLSLPLSIWATLYKPLNPCVLRFLHL